MKQIKLFVAIVATLFVLSCSEHDDPVNDEKKSVDYSKVENIYGTWDFLYYYCVNSWDKTPTTFSIQLYKDGTGLQINGTHRYKSTYTFHNGIVEMVSDCGTYKDHRIFTFRNYTGNEVAVGDACVNCKSYHEYSDGAQLSKYENDYIARHLPL